jgi:hypothetical protein
VATASYASNTFFSFLFHVYMSYKKYQIKIIDRVDYMPKNFRWKDVQKYVPTSSLASVINIYCDDNVKYTPTTMSIDNNTITYSDGINQPISTTMKIEMYQTFGVKNIYFDDFEGVVLNKQKDLLQENKIVDYLFGSPRGVCRITGNFKKENIFQELYTLVPNDNKNGFFYIQILYSESIYRNPKTPPRTFSFQTIPFKLNMFEIESLTMTELKEYFKTKSKTKPPMILCKEFDVPLHYEFITNKDDAVCSHDYIKEHVWLPKFFQTERKPFDVIRLKKWMISFGEQEDVHRLDLQSFANNTMIYAVSLDEKYFITHQSCGYIRDDTGTMTYNKLEISICYLL